MKLVRWEIDGDIGEGFVIDDRLVKFPDSLTTHEVITRGLTAALELGSRCSKSDGISMESAKLLAPLIPASIRDFVAFEEHVEGMTASPEGTSNVPREWYTYPTFYFTNPHSIIPTGKEVIPPQTERLDFELEVGAIIGGVPGRDGDNLTPDEGKQAIFGYTIFNDWSARDLQGREMQVRLGPAKGKDFATTLGPWIVTADEFESRIDADGFLAIQMQVLVNGEIIGTDLLSNMGWPFGELVAYASRNTRVVPGDVLGSGTAGNGGCLGELWGRRGEFSPPPLKTGDTVLMRVEGIGEIENRVGKAPSVPHIPPARPRNRARSNS
jgi:2-keto-4-pentenoate hydratase/2-oxohepta-3-ene-1,7-dioic acid hydratase in catechol pathway